jgi:hypothetical protein
MGFGHRHDLLVVADRGGAHAGALASIIAIGGFVCLFAWVAWRFGPTLMRFCGLASWWAGWACGSQGGFGYMIFLVILGTLSWGVGTIWYHARRGRWPSLLSQRLFTRSLRTRSASPDRRRAQQPQPQP